MLLLTSQNVLLYLWAVADSLKGAVCHPSAHFEMFRDMSQNQRDGAC